MEGTSGEDCLSSARDHSSGRPVHGINELSEAFDKPRSYSQQRSRSAAFLFRNAHAAPKFLSPGRRFS
jgi:hypothetical protein